MPLFVSQRLGAALFAAALSMLSIGVSAAVVQHDFSARVTFVDTRLGGAAAVGQMAQGAYRIETSTPDSAAAADVGLYFNAGALPTLTLGALAWHAAQVDISLSNLLAVDIYRVDGGSTSGSAISGAGATWRLDSVALTLTDNLFATALASDMLMAQPPRLADFNIRGLTLTFLDGANGVASIQAEVTALTQAVPLPGTAWLVLAAVGALPWVRRRPGVSAPVSIPASA